nr:immunoglobulin heavy chain junction region [Mus musculus]
CARREAGTSEGDYW